MNATSFFLFAIKRYALHDGPNIRLTVFFKGCPLSCFWCHNPEGIAPHVQLVTVMERCIGCQACLAGCPEGALHLSEQAVLRDLERCSLCLNCVEICPALAHEAIGQFSTLTEVVAEIEKERPFFDQSDGGVTFSGGEPLLQADALRVLLDACGRLEVHRAVDTTGFAPTATILDIARLTDLFLYDIKHMDSELHRRYTGVPNELILHNLQMLSRAGATIRIRVPLLAGINDDEPNIEAAAAFTATLAGIQGIDILPYHHLAGNKYRKLGRTCSAEAALQPSPASIQRAVELFTRYGHTVSIGG